VTSVWDADYYDELVEEGIRAHDRLLLELVERMLGRDGQLPLENVDLRHLTMRDLLERPELMVPGAEA
jgi:hypothetical protein